MDPRSADTRLVPWPLTKINASTRVPARRTGSSRRRSSLATKHRWTASATPRAGSRSSATIPPWTGARGRGRSRSLKCASPTFGVPAGFMNKLRRWIRAVTPGPPTPIPPRCGPSRSPPRLPARTTCATLGILPTRGPQTWRATLNGGADSVSLLKRTPTRFATSSARSS